MTVLSMVYAFYANVCVATAADRIMFFCMIKLSPQKHFCVYENAMSQFSLVDLERIVRERASASPDESYTAKLLRDGVEKTAKKFGEEAIEAVIAGVKGDKVELRNEAADVLYHLLVMLSGAGVPLSDVMDELNRRTSQTGLAEKASRRP
jgi:phosphoribosyl-ATP pyrophosphohydrolase